MNHDGRNLWTFPDLIRFLLMAAVVALSAMPNRSRAQSEAETFNLRPRWQQGQTSRYEFWSLRTDVQTFSMRGNDHCVERSIETEGQIVWKVQHVRADGSSTCTMTVDWMTAALRDTDDESYFNDSRKSKGDYEAIHDVLRAIAGVPLKVEVAADGTITDLSGTKAIRRQVKVESLVPEDLDYLESASELATLVGAPAQLSVGKSWKTDFRWTQSTGVPFLKSFIKKKTTFTLSSVEELEGISIATVTAQARMKLEIDRSEVPAEAPPMGAKMIDSSFESQIMFDLRRAEAVGRNTVEHRTIDVTIRPPQQTFRQRLDQTIHSQLLRIAEVQ